jgi:hypothetical protein
MKNENRNWAGSNLRKRASINGTSKNMSAINRRALHGEKTKSGVSTSGIEPRRRAAATGYPGNLPDRGRDGLLLTVNKPETAGGTSEPWTHKCEGGTDSAPNQNDWKKIEPTNSAKRKSDRYRTQSRPSTDAHRKMRDMRQANTARGGRPTPAHVGCN